MRSLRYTIIIIIIGIIVYFVAIWPQQKYFYAHHVKINGTYLIKPIEIDNFALIDHRGNHFTRDNLKNHWTLIFFGFTRCSNVCPVTLNALNHTYKTLQKMLPQKDLPQVIFVSIDPENDTLKQLNKYVKTFNPHFIGAITSAEKIENIKKQFHIAVTKTQGSLNHSPEVLLINPDTEIQAYFSYPIQPQQMAKDYYAIINKEK